MSKKVTIRIGKEPYEGRTTKEATGKALAHLERLVSEGWWAPVIIRAPDADGGENVGVVYKDFDGSWAYTISWAGSIDGERVAHTSYGQTREQATFSVRRHLAQAAYRPGGPDTFAILHETDTEGRADHASWIKFQESYAAARAAGKTDEEARRAAGY